MGYVIEVEDAQVDRLRQLRRDVWWAGWRGHAEAIDLILNRVADAKDGGTINHISASDAARMVRSLMDKLEEIEEQFNSTVARQQDELERKQDEIRDLEFKVAEANAKVEMAQRVASYGGTD